MTIPEKILRRYPRRVQREFRHWVKLLYDDSVRFSMPESPIHAKQHCERVLLHTLSLTDTLLPADDEAMEIEAHAAIFHDSRRHDDYIDTGHGARGAVYYREYTEHHPDLRYHPEAAEAMRYHDLPDERGNEAIDTDFKTNTQKVHLLYDIFKDADALDRPRLGPLGLDPSFLRTEPAKERISEAIELVHETMNPDVLERVTREVDEAIRRQNEPKRLLLIVDPQIDFINGSLPVTGAVEAMDKLAEYVKAHPDRYIAKLLTADRHDYDHISFTDHGGEWPRHCVVDTVGAAFWPALFDALHSTPGEVKVIHKGEDRDYDEYSALASEGHCSTLQRLIGVWHISIIDICGIAGDVCVLSTLKDGRKAFPDIVWNPLTEFCPSIDGGEKLRRNL